MKCADEDFEEATVPSDDAASAMTFVAVAVVASFAVPACLAEYAEDGVRAGSTSSVAAVADVAEAEDFAEAGRVASDSPADAAPPLLAQLLEQRPAPSQRFVAVLAQVSLAA